MPRPRVLLDLAVFLWPLLILAAFLDFAFGDFLPALAPFLSGIPGGAVADDLGIFFSRFALITTAILFTLLLPGLLRCGSEARVRFYFRALIICCLIFLGTAVIQTLTSSPWVLAAQNLVFVLLYLSLAGFAWMKSLGRLRAAHWSAWFIGLAMPHLWRLCFEVQGGEPVGSTFFRVIRLSGDILIPCAGALFLATVPFSGISKRLTLAALVPAVFFAALMFLFFDAAQKLLIDLTDLYLTSLPKYATIVIIPLSLAGLVRLILGAVLRHESTGLAVALFLTLMSGFLPLSTENLAMALIAAVLFGVSMEGQAETPRALVDVLR